MGAHRNFSTEGQGLGDMASVERYNGALGRSAQGGPGTESLVREVREQNP